MSWFCSPDFYMVLPLSFPNDAHTSSSYKILHMLPLDRKYEIQYSIENNLLAITILFLKVLKLVVVSHFTNCW